MRCRYPTHQFQTPCSHSMAACHCAASITTIPHTAGGGNMESEPTTKNRGREDEGKRVTSAEETQGKSAKINGGHQNTDWRGG